MSNKVFSTNSKKDVKAKTVKLRKYGSSLNVWHTVFSIISNGEKEYILDFESVKSVTPSFAYELILNSVSKNIQIFIKNANEEITSQLKRAIKLIETTFNKKTV